MNTRRLLDKESWALDDGVTVSFGGMQQSPPTPPIRLIVVQKTTRLSSMRELSTVPIAEDVWLAARCVDGQLFHRLYSPVNHSDRKRNVEGQVEMRPRQLLSVHTPFEYII